MKENSEHALQLIEKILSNEIQFLSQEEADFLLEHKEVCVRKLLPILALQVTQVKEGECWDPYILRGCIKLLAGFQEERAFDWIIQLHEFPEVLQDESSCFILRFWADVLVATISSDWYKLKPFIEDLGIDFEIREVCVEVLVLLVARQRIDRSVVIDYFNELYSQALSGYIKDPELLLLLVEASICIGPEESLEQIRELFGYGLIDDEGYIDLLDVLEALDDGQEECLADVNNWVTHIHLYDYFKKDEELEEDSEEDFFEFDEEELSFLEEEAVEYFEEAENSVQSLFPDFEIQGLSSKEQKKYRSIPNLLLEDSEQALETVSELFADHPDSPILLYSFYYVLQALNEKVIATQVLKKWVERFPNDLLGKIEYAHYFLRRGEPEKVRDIFSDTWSLSELYPERASFHEIECLKFFYLMGCYFLQIEEVEKAQQQAQFLDAMSPRSFECLDLQRKIALHLQEDSFIEDL